MPKDLITQIYSFIMYIQCLPAPRARQSNSAVIARLAKQDPVLWQTPVLMRLIFPVIAAYLFGCRPRSPGDLNYVEKRNCCNAY